MANPPILSAKVLRNGLYTTVGALTPAVNPRLTASARIVTLVVPVMAVDAPTVTRPAGPALLKDTFAPLTVPCTIPAPELALPILRGVTAPPVCARAMSPVVLIPPSICMVEPVDLTLTAPPDVGLMAEVT